METADYSSIGRILHHYWDGQGMYTIDDFGNAINVDVLLALQFIRQVYVEV